MSRRCLGCMELFDDAFEICPHCGYAVGTRAEEAIHMHPGTLLHDRYIIGRVLGFGGFGVTYLGWDGRLEQKVAIKEYLPGEFSTRMPGQSQITVFNGDRSEQFHDGMKKFIEEAKHLAKFQNEPGIVKIFDSFEENDTAYIIMEYLEGETLTSFLDREKTIPEDQAVQMLMPVMESLQVVHAEGLLHRDIAPDNIFLTKSGEIKLIDFGASRYATTSHSRSLTVIIKPGYSPEEQYRNRGDQGPYTDVYALAGTLYKMLTGKTPPDAMERRAKYENQNKDILIPPHKLNKTISPNREVAILNAMNVRIEDRTQDVAAFVRELNADPPAKRRHGKIRKLNFYAIPLWLKIAVPVLVAVLAVFGTLLATGVIDFSNFSEELIIPENVVIVPDAEGMAKEEAIALITKQKLLVSTNGTVESEYIPAGLIVLQTPVGGMYMDINATVLLTISSGKAVESPSDGVATVPYVVWDAQDAALKKLEAAGLGTPEIVKKNDEHVAAGHVISQSEKADTQLPEGTVIQLTVSIGPAAFKLQDFVNMEEKQAVDQLTAQGLVANVEYVQDDSVPEGHVVSQSVAAGTDVKRGDTVVLTVSSGKPTVIVADVVGQQKNSAKSVLVKQGFKVTVLENYSSDVKAGYVISQTPAAGSSQLPGSGVTIYVSKGRQKISVVFQANGGTCSETGKTVYHGSELGELPAAYREHYIFEGWYTSPDGGMQYTERYKVTGSKNVTLYAHWSLKKYTVSWRECAHCRIKVSREASPNAYAPSEVLSSGSTVYYGDVLKISYLADSGYDIQDQGVTSVTVSGSLGSDSIYASAAVKQYTVSWAQDSHCSISVRRTSSPYQGASTGSLSSGSAIYYGDVLSISYGADTGFELGSCGITSATVSGNVGANRIYASAAAKQYTVSWNRGSHCSISVRRTSSPYRGASTGSLSSGSAIYYGDVLSISYSADSGYKLTDHGTTSVTVSGNVGSSQIYASTGVNSYTYRILYRSTNGTNLGSDTVTHDYGSAYTVSAPEKSGYRTPASQSVSWDSTGTKEIVFRYEPIPVSNGPRTGEISNYWTSGKKYPTVTYKAEFEYRNRRADSVEIRVTVSETIKATFWSNNVQRVRVSAGGTSIGDIVVAEYREWNGQVNYDRTSTAYTEWVRVPLNTAGATSITVNAYFYNANLNGTDLTGSGYASLHQSWGMNIPAY